MTLVILQTLHEHSSLLSISRTFVLHAATKLILKE